MRWGGCLGAEAGGPACVAGGGVRFTVLADDDGSILWITRGGWIFRRRPQGY